MKPPDTSSCVRFGLFDFNTQSGELRKQGIRVKLGQHAVKILVLLLERRGQLLTREEIRQMLWGTNTFVNFEQSLNKAIHQLREALEDQAAHPHYIETVAGQGYRFIYFAQESSQPIHKPRRKLDSFAVLPFVTEPANREMELLGRRIVESITDSIARTRGIKTLAYRTVQHSGENDLNPCQAGRNLLVRAIVVGEMIRPNDELLLHAELIDASDGTQLWGAQFKEPFADVLARPEELALKISDKLRRILVRWRRRKGCRRAA